VGAPLEPRLEGVIQLVEAGELGVAFEILLDNLLDYDIPISQVERASLRDLGTTLGLGQRRLANIGLLGSPHEPESR
jgi:hypothetical protein